jgi:hypothetical protein
MRTEPFYAAEFAGRFSGVENSLRRQNNRFEWEASLIPGDGRTIGCADWKRQEA